MPSSPVPEPVQIGHDEQPVLVLKAHELDIVPGEGEGINYCELRGFANQWIERWTDLDPNSQNAYLIMAQAANQLEDAEMTQAAIQAVDGLEVTVNDLTLRRSPAGGATVNGSVVNKTLNQGDSVSYAAHTTMEYRNDSDGDCEILLLSDSSQASG